MSDKKVYSPDIKPYSFEGNSGLFGTLSSIVVGPIRLLSRVMHNIFILPANLQVSYAKGLKMVSGILLVAGVAELVVVRKWPLLVSQIPVLYYAFRLEAKASKATAIAQEKREVEVDLDKVGALCNTIYDEYNELLKEEE